MSNEFNELLYESLDNNQIDPMLLEEISRKVAEWKQAIPMVPRASNELYVTALHKYLDGVMFYCDHLRG